MPIVLPEPSAEQIERYRLERAALLVRQRMGLLSMSPERLAAAAGLQPATLQNILDGRLDQVATADVVAALAVFGLTVDAAQQWDARAVTVEADRAPLNPKRP